MAGVGPLGRTLANSKMAHPIKGGSAPAPRTNVRGATPTTRAAHACQFPMPQNTEALANYGRDVKPPRALLSARSDGFRESRTLWSHGAGMSAEWEFTAIVDLNRSRLLRYALRRVDRSSVEDVVAETFSIAWRRWGERPDDGNDLYWLYGIARFVIANSDRGQRRRLRLRTRLSTERNTSIDQNPFGPSSDETAELTRLIGQLTDLDREALRLAYWEELTHSQIGLVLGCSENAIELRLRRARKELKSRLEMLPQFLDRRAVEQ
jgi:RNA polymerase sigma-70 factor, ECF subfamily